MDPPPPPPSPPLATRVVTTAEVEADASSTLAAIASTTNHSSSSNNNRNMSALFPPPTPPPPPEDAAVASDGEDVLPKVRNLVRRITAARPSPHPRFLHTLAAILEREEARFQQELGYPSASSARSSHTIGRLANLIRENDEFFELLSSKLLVEARYCTAVRAAAARLLLACLTCGMYPDVFEDTVLANIKQWVAEDTAKHFSEGVSPKKSGNTGATKVKKSDYADWEMLKTYATGLLAIALAAGVGVVKDVLTTGVATKLMHFLRIRSLKETSNQREASQITESRPLNVISAIRSKEDARSRVKFPLEIPRVDVARDTEEYLKDQRVERVNEKVNLSNEKYLEECKIEEEEVLVGKAICAYDADDDRDWVNDDKCHKRDLWDGRPRVDCYNATCSGRDDDMEEAGRGEPSRRRGDARNLKIKVRGRVADSVAETDKGLGLLSSGIRIGNQLEKSKMVREKCGSKADLGGQLKTDTGVKETNKDVDGSTLAEGDKDTYEIEADSIVGNLNISKSMRKAAKAAQAEAKAVKAPVEAVKAVGEAAAELVKAAAMEAFAASNDNETALAAAAAAAATVVDAAAATKSRRKDLDISNGLSKEEFENKTMPEMNMLEFADLGDCVLDTESLAKLRERYCVQCLEKMGEYLEVLGPVLHERGVDVCLALLQRESGDVARTKDRAMLADVLKLICALAPHRKFAAMFVDKGGVQQLLAVPRVPQTYMGISLCLFAFASLQVVMERVCTLPSDIVNEVVALALQLLECKQDFARRNAASFFGAAFVFRSIIDSVDAQDGLSKMLNLLRNVTMLRSGGGTGAPGSSSTSTGSRTDRGASAEVLTSSEKQVAYHTCVALRQYFRAHLLILVDSLRPFKGRSGSRNLPGGRAAYKPLDVSNEAVESVMLQLQRDRKLGPAFVRARWPALEKFMMSYNGHTILLDLTQVSPGERYLYESVQHALGVLQIVTLMPFTRRLVVGSTLSNGRSGMAVIIDAASTAAFAGPEVIQPALLVLVNLVCPPPSLSSRPYLPPNAPVAVQHNHATISVNGTGNLENKDRLGKGDSSSDRHVERSLQIPVGQSDVKDKSLKADGNVDKHGERSGALSSVQALPSGSIQPHGAVSPASAVVGDRRISLGPGSGSSGLAAYMEQGYRQAREAVRSNNGIKVLLNLLHPRTVLLPASLDCIRALACRVLLGLARDDAIAHILTKLQVGKLLSELLRDGGSHAGRSMGSNGIGGEHGRWQSELGQVAMELIAIVTNTGRASTLVASDATAPTLRRIERAAIAAATPISYHSRELLVLIHEHLVASGLANSAATLLKEAQLVPLPSSFVPYSLANQSNPAESSLDQWWWPTGRTPGGFLVKVQTLKEDESGNKNDQLQFCARKRGPSFSSALMLGSRMPQLLSSSVGKISCAKDYRVEASKRYQDNQISASAPRDGIAECDTLKVPSNSLPVKRKVLDRDMSMLLPSKRPALNECGVCAPSLLTPPRLRNNLFIENSLPHASPITPVQRDALSRQTTGQQQPPVLERLDSAVAQNDSIASGDNQQTHMHYYYGMMNQAHASVLPSSASLLSDAPPPQSERATLDSLVVQYLKHQHRQCPAPITTLPPLSLFHQHLCPEPNRAGYASLNTAGRLAVREMIPPYGGTQGRRRDRHFVYSRFRPWRTCRDEGVLLTCTAFLGSTFHVASGSHGGDIRIFDCSSGNVLETHVCHQSPISLLQAAPKDLASTVELTGSHPGQLLLSSGSYDVRLWNTSALGDGPLHSFEGCRSARFNHSGNMLAAISSELLHREVLLYDVQTGKLEHRLSDTLPVSSGSLRGHGTQSIVHFNPSDSLLLWNGMLWDHRIPQSIHRFDQFTDYGGGGFHPAGNEVIINSEVWDLRSLKLLRNVPSLDQTIITFNTTGDVIYAILRRNTEDIMSAFHHRRSRHPLFTAFRTMDAVDYTDIATTSVDRCVLDLATEPTDSLISVVAMDGNDEMDSFARLYEIGRRRPTEDDSDPDDGVETEDEEESEGEEAAEDEDLVGEGEDSDLDGSNDEDDASGDEDEVEEDGDADYDSNDEEDDEDVVDMGEGILEIVSDGDDETRVSYSTGDDESAGEFDEELDDMLEGFF